MSSPSNGWPVVVRSVEKRHPCLARLRVAPGRLRHPGGRYVEELPAFLKVAIATAFEGLEVQGEKPLRLAMVAPRWREGALWTAAGAALCSLKDDFERKRAALPDFPVGKKLLLDKSKVVQYEGEDAKGLRLRVADGILTVPRSYRLRLQPTETRRPLSPLPWAGQTRPDALDELLSIDCQGARHIFSTRVVLVTSVARSVEIARGAQAASFQPEADDPISPAVLQLIRRVRLQFFPNGEAGAKELSRSGGEALYQRLMRAEALYLEIAQDGGGREPLANCLQKANEELRRNFVANHQMPKSSERLVQALSLVRPPQQSGAGSVDLLNLFQWGALGLDGTVEIISAGQMEADPVILLCSDLLALRHYLREKAAQLAKDPTACPLPLVILDGSACFRNRLDVLNHIIDSGAPVLACLDRCEEEAAAPLTARGFELWKWMPADLGELVASTASTPVGATGPAPLFASLQTSLGNYSRHRLQEHVCHHDGIGGAADSLMDMLGGLDPAQPETKTLEGALFGTLLHTARLLHAPEGDAATHLEERTTRAREEIARCGLWLTTETQNQANSLLQALEHAASMPCEGDKSEGLFSVIAKSNLSSICVVVADTRAIEPMREAWKRFLSGLGAEEIALMAGKVVSFCCPASAEAHLSATRAGHLVICGWLGANRMRQLLDGCLAADITLLLYPFERGWLRGALRRWRGPSQSISSKRRLSLLGLSRGDLQIELREMAEEPLSPLVNDEREPEKVASQFDAGEFELRLRLHRRASLASAGRMAEEKEPTRLIEFSGEHFAFLAEGCRLPVVNDLLHRVQIEGESDGGLPVRGELPQKKASELEVGDYVVFRRGAAGNLIREMADLSLRRSGMGHLRQTSRLWKTALRGWFEAEQERAAQEGEDASRRAIIKKLQKAGIKRGELTIRFWLEQDRVIGPSDDEVLKTLARITGHEEFNRKLPDVMRAISRVRGAHLSASEQLTRALMQRLPEHLSRSLSAGSDIEDALDVDIEGIGAAVVVRVEEIADELVPVARSQVNVLQREVEENSPIYSSDTLLSSVAASHRPTGLRLEGEEDVLRRTAALDGQIEVLMRQEGF